ncbi:MAG: AraC family transcriptional regulator [Flavobacteriales bacterium]|nr:AraC family transcriptional regulator [Flavobacteriales bacterium]MCB9913335.1 AraC family transcriptional regulator [Planctomycetota bacterium]MCP5524380.1 AraC family transcriptional regulator [Verrucomicrobiales bacterium]
MTATKVMTDRFKVPSLLARQLREHEVSLPAVLRRAELPTGFFQQDKIYVTTTELFALWRAIGETSPDPAIGLKLGAEPRLERYQPTAIAAVCSRTFRDALQRIGRYKRLTCPEEIRVRTSGDEASVEFVYLQAEAAQPNVMVDLVLSWILGIGHRGTEEQITPLRLELTRPIQNRELLEHHFGCRVRFKSSRNALIFRNCDLDRPFVTENEELLQAIGAQLEAELQERTIAGNVGVQVRHTLKRSLAGKRPTLQQVARELCMSPRTLQRRLTDAALTFQQLVEETRRELARHYLRHSTVELNETAFLLGFEDANSFFRAFQTWEGTSPGAWRSRHCVTGTAA